VHFSDKESYYKTLIGNVGMLWNGTSFDIEWPGFQGLSIYKIIFQKRCKTAIVTIEHYNSHIRFIERCHLQWPWMTPNPGFKITLRLKGIYLKTVHFILSNCR